MLRKLTYQIGLALLDVALISLAFYLSYAMRFDFSIPEDFVVQIRELMPIVILAYLGALLYFGLHRGMWCYAA